MKNYELTVIFNENCDNMMGIFTDIVHSVDGIIDSYDGWGRKRLAYPIQGEEYGLYAQGKIRIDPAYASKLSDKLIQNDNVLRYLLVTITKEEEE